MDRLCRFLALVPKDMLSASSNLKRGTHGATCPVRLELDIEAQFKYIGGIKSMYGEPWLIFSVWYGTIMAL